MAIHELFPYICVHDAAAAIDFYCKVFEVKEIFRLTEPSGRIGHAELDFHNGAILMLSDEFAECNIHSAKTLGGTAVTLHLHVDDADALVAWRRRTSSMGNVPASFATPSAIAGTWGTASRS